MTTFFWTKYPFVRVGIAFILGIFLAYYMIDLPDFKMNTTQWKMLCYGVVVLCIATVYVSFVSLRPNLLIVLIVFFFIGFFCFLLEDPRIQKTYLKHEDQQQTEVVCGHIVTEPELKNSKITFTLSLDSVFYHNKWLARKGLVKTTLNKVNNYALGESVIAKGRLKTITPTSNPFDFNYAAYLAYQKTYYTLYAQSAQSLVYNNSYHPILWTKQKAILCRMWIEGIIIQNIQNTSYQQIIIGLVTGKRTDLSTEDKSLFTNSGTIHVLAISGMHIVLIYQVIVLFLFHTKVNTSNVFANLIILGLIWFYIFITGLNASAVRAGIMISIVLIGKLTYKHPQHINSLFATALIMLLYNPYYIADIGFCLSFLAIIGILLTSNIKVQKQGIKHYFLQSSTISASAQATTMPLSILLFQQFPLYFLVANLIVVPLSTCLLFSAIGLIAFHTLPYISTLLILFMDALCGILFYTLKTINNLPYALLKHIAINTQEMILMYVLLTAVVMAIYSKQKYWLWVLTTMAILLACSINMHIIKAHQSCTLLISGHKKSRQYVFIKEAQAYILKEAPNSPNTFATEKILSQYFVKKTKEITLPHEDSFRMDLGEQSFVICRKEAIHPIIPSKKTSCCIIDYKSKYSYLPLKKFEQEHKEMHFVYSNGKETTYIKQLSL